MCEVVVSVPISKERLKERGYNQSELIAKKTAECLGIPYANCMIKTKHNSEQHRLHLKDRKENVKGVYELEENKPVSYTHLDVYKRQEHGSVNGLMRAKRKV